MSPIDVDVSIIDKEATLLSFLDPPVLLPLFGLVSMSQPQPKCCSHCEYAFDVSIINKTATFLLFKDLSVLSIVCSTS
jgi:hypothetical protein